MRRAIATVVSIAAMVVACSSSSSGGGASAGHCAVSARGCRCQAAAFTLASDETPATSCSAKVAPSGVTWSSLSCCYDLDSDGKTTTCDCATYICWQDAGHDECVCGYYDASTTIPPDAVKSSCDKTATNSLCCQAANVDLGNTCSCNGHYGSCSGRGEPYASSPTITTCGVVNRGCPGKKTATSCDGLVWKASAPSSGGGGSGGSHCTPTGDTCGGDVDCCPGHRCNSDSTSSNYRTCS